MKKPFLVVFFVFAFFPVISQAKAETFLTWLNGFKQRAVTQGISQKTVTQVLNFNTPLKSSIKADKSQPEYTRTFQEYYDRAVSSYRIKKGQTLGVKYRHDLHRIASQYGVPYQILLALWGMETNYGQYARGKYDVPRTLATLAYDGRRRAFFEEQLMDALKMVDSGKVSRSLLKGSWAGAMGHMQFMPKTFIKYAVDYDNDGQEDIWTNVPEAMASAANYLKSIGWRADERWGREVSLSAGFPYELADRKLMKTVTQWKNLGVKKANGQPLDSSNIKAALILPQGARGSAFLIYHNFATILDWNRSINYALTIGLISDKIKGRAGLVKRAPKSTRIHWQTLVKIQKKLTQLGYDTGGADGQIGYKTRKALRTFQKSQKLVADGFPNSQTVQRILQGQ